MSGEQKLTLLIIGKYVKLRCIKNAYLPVADEVIYCSDHIGPETIQKPRSEGHPPWYENGKEYETYLLNAISFMLYRWKQLKPTVIQKCFSHAGSYSREEAWDFA